MALRAATSGTFRSSFSTARGIHTSENCSRRRFRRPMRARLEMGEVLLTTGIGEIFDQFLFSVVPRDPSLRHDVGETKPAFSGKLRRFSEGKKALRVERNGQLLAQTLLGFGFGIRRLRVIESGMWSVM